MQGGVLSPALLLPASCFPCRDKSIEGEKGRSANHVRLCFRTPFSICGFLYPNITNQAGLLFQARYRRDSLFETLSAHIKSRTAYLRAAAFWRWRLFLARRGRRSLQSLENIVFDNPNNHWLSLFQKTIRWFLNFVGTGVLDGPFSYSNLLSNKTKERKVLLCFLLLTFLSRKKSKTHPHSPQLS